MTPPDQRMAYRLLKNNHMTLDWIELGKQLDTEFDELREMVELARRARAEGRMTDAEWHTAAQVFVDQIRELNRRIIGYNMRVPHVRFQRPPYPIDADLV